MGVFPTIREVPYMLVTRRDGADLRDVARAFHAWGSVPLLSRKYAVCCTPYPCHVSVSVVGSARACDVMQQSCRHELGWQSTGQAEGNPSGCRRSCSLPDTCAFILRTQRAVRSHCFLQPSMACSTLNSGDDCSCAAESCAT